MLNISFAIIGDPAICDPWRVFGRGQAQKMHAHGKLVAEWPLDDVTVKVEVYGNDAHVTVRQRCIFYVETGAIALGHWGVTYMEDVDTCWVHRAGVPGITNHPILGTIKLPDGDPYLSRLYALKEPPTKLPINPPPRKEDYESPLGGTDIRAFKCATYPDQCDLLQRKAILMFLNPSRGTGKMRMFLQSLLGSRIAKLRLSYSYGNAICSFDELVINPADYVIRDNNGEYWMMNSVTSYHLTFTKCGDSIKSALRAGGLSRMEESKLESVLFSLLYVRPRPEPTPAVPYPQLPGTFENIWPVPTGAALQYDWHFAYQQSKAIRVGHVTSGFSMCDGYVCALEELTFTTEPRDETTAESLPPKANLRLVESGTRSLVRGREFIWNIDPSTNTQYTYFPHTCLGAFGGPMYAFFDSNDLPVIVRYKREYEKTDAQLREYDYRSVCGVGEFGNETVAPGSVTSGLFVAGKWDSVRARESISTFQHNENSREAGSTRLAVYSDFTGVDEGTLISMGKALYPFNSSCDTASFYAYREQAPLSIYQTVGTALSTNKSGWKERSGSSFILFPLNNPDAVYLGKHTDDIESSTDVKTQYNGGLISELVINGQLRVASSVSYDTSALTPPEDTHQEISGGLDAPETDQVVLITQYRTITVASGWRNTFIPAAPPQEPEYSGERSTWHEVFHPLISDGVHENVHLDVRESINGLLQYDADTSTTKCVGAFPVGPIYFIGHA